MLSKYIHLKDNLFLVNNFYDRQHEVSLEDFEIIAVQEVRKLGSRYSILATSQSFIPKDKDVLEKYDMNILKIMNLANKGKLKKQVLLSQAYEVKLRTSIIPKEMQAFLLKKAV